MSHSTGSRLAYYFLKQMQPEWKNKYIRKFISVAGAFGGTVGSLVAQVSGQYDGPFGLRQEPSIKMHRSFSGFLFDSPQPSVFNDTIIFAKDGIEYTAADMIRILEIVGHKQGLKQWHKLSHLIKDNAYGDPGVDYICIRGKGVPTWESIVYPKHSLIHRFPLHPYIKRGDGDGIVNAISADVCDNWHGKRMNKGVDFLGISHQDMVKDENVLNYITKQVERINDEE